MLVLSHRLCMNWGHHTTLPSPDNNMRKARRKAGEPRPGWKEFIPAMATVYATNWHQLSIKKSAVPQE